MTGNYNYQSLPAFTKGELTQNTWNEERRQELIELFRSEEYGRIHEEASLTVSHRVAEIRQGFMIGNSGGKSDGMAVRKIVEIIVRRKVSGIEREYIIPFYLFVPEGAEKKPVPVVLTLVNRSLSDADPSRKNKSPFWPAEMIVSRGYAAAAIVTHEIAPDYEDGFTTRFHRLFPEYTENRPPDAWGALSAWAWAMSRAIDYLVTDPAIDASKIITAGHSRGGKTSLWCGAQDTRVSIVISSCSGCSGAAITRGKTGEHIKDITSRFPFWFCNNYWKYADNEDTMPFDQHLLLGLIAPRPLYLSEKTEDSWCDARAEFESLKQASKIYELYGKPSPLAEMPGADEGIISGSLGFHLQTGEHNMDEYDWERYLNFCDLF